MSFLCRLFDVSCHILLGFMFDEHLTFSDQIRPTSLPNACYYHIRQLCCIRPYLDSSISCTIATSKLDYCNSLYYKIPKSQLSRFQQIQNSLARTFVKAPNSCHITPILYALSTGSGRLNTSSFHLPTKFSTTQPPYLHNLISVHSPLSTRSLSVVILARPPSSTSLKITDRSFRYAYLVSGITESAALVSSSTSFWYQFLHFLLTYSFTHLLLPFLIHHSAHP